MKKYRLLITGSRTWDDYDTICREIIAHIQEYVKENPHLQNKPIDWFTIVHGNCPRGADKLADIFGRTVLRCDIELYEADWRVGRHAGYLRNARMVESMPDACLVFLRDKSPGTTGCRKLAKAKGIPTETIDYDPEKLDPPKRKPQPKGIIKKVYDDGSQEITGI
jgi:hypothetical protein